VLLALRRQCHIEAAGGQGQVLLDQGQHRAQVGTFREPITPTPLQGFQHRGADARFQGELAQIQPPRFSLLAQPPAHRQQRIFLGEPIVCIAGPLAAATPEQAAKAGQARGKPGH
jgi:hypothetical protein